MSVYFEPLRAQVTERNPILGKTKVRSKVQQNKTDYCSNKKAQSGGWGIKQGKTGCSLGIDLGFCRLVVVLPTSSQYPPNLFPTSSLFLSISFLYDTYTYTYAYVCYIVPVQNRHCVGWLLSSQLPPNILPTSSQRPPSS